MGDEQTWRMRFNVNSPASRDTLMKLIADGVEATGGWTRLSGSDAGRWQGEMEGRHVVLGFRAHDSGAADGFALEVTIDVDEDLDYS